MEKMIMTAKGIYLLERIIRSCPPRMSNSGLEAKERLFALSKSGKNISIDYFLEELEIKDLSESVFGHFLGAAEHLGVSEINDQFVVEYFAGEFHSSEIARKMEEGDIRLMEEISSLFKWYVTVMHMLMPCHIENLSKLGFAVRYDNGEMNFTIKNLIPYGCDLFGYEKDDLVWVHLSSVIGKADKKLAEIALESQEKNVVFQKACRKIPKSGLDARVLIQYSHWAKEACKMFQK